MMRSIAVVGAVAAAVCMVATPAQAADSIEDRDAVVLDGSTSQTVVDEVRDPVCEEITEASMKDSECLAELTVSATAAEPADASDMSDDGALLAGDGKTSLAAAAAKRTIYTRTWSQQYRGLYYFNWVEKHSGRIYFDKAGHVWSTTKTYGMKGSHICGQSSGIGYVIAVKKCNVEKRYDLSRPAISQWDRFQVHVVYKSIPLYVSKKMHSNAYDNGKITFPK